MSYWLVLYLVLFNLPETAKHRFRNLIILEHFKLNQTKFNFEFGQLPHYAA